MRARAGEPPVWRRHTSDDGFEDGIDGVDANYSSFVPTLLQRKNPRYYKLLATRRGRRLRARVATKICDSLIFCAPHKK